VRIKQQRRQVKPLKLVHLEMDRPPGVAQRVGDGGEGRRPIREWNQLV
jgi:hypothetical protein